MLEVDERGRLKRNGWAAGKISSPISELLPSEEQMIELWEQVRARARAISPDIFIVTGSVQAPDPPLVSVVTRFIVRRDAVNAARAVHFNLIGLERDLHQMYHTVVLEQAVEDGVLIPEFGIFVRISSSEDLPALTVVLEEIAVAVSGTRLGEFVASRED